MIIVAIIINKVKWIQHAPMTFWKNWFVEVPGYDDYFCYLAH